MALAKSKKIIFVSVIAGLMLAGYLSSRRATEANNTFPAYEAIFTCGANGFNMDITGCFIAGVKTQLELTNGSNYGLYQAYELNSVGNTAEDGSFRIPLHNHFEIKAQNARENVTLGLKIIKVSTGETIFQKQVAQYGVISVKN